MKQKEESKERISIALLAKILTVLLIILISFISFGGIYVVDRNSTKNLVPDYKLGSDVYGTRNIVIKVDNSETDAEEQEVLEDTENENTSEEITEEQSEEVEEESGEKYSKDDYIKAKKIIEQRLSYMEISDYSMRLNEEDGTISIDVPENSTTDYVAQYCITPGVFVLEDEASGEVLLGNSDIKDAKVGYQTSSAGTTVYLSIEFNKDAVNKLKDISNTYIKSQDDEGNDTSKNVAMKIDDETILSSYFDEEITDGMISISLGTSTDSATIQSYLQQASNIAVFLNTDPILVKYSMEINRFVFSDIEFENEISLLIICGVIVIIAGIYMIVRYRKLGLLGTISTLGFISILLLAMRFGNVALSLSGMATIILMLIVEVVIVVNMLRAYKLGIEDNSVKNNMIRLMKKVITVLIPIVVISIVFALFSTYSLISSMGMTMFWAIITMALYNILVLGMILFNPMKKS